MQHAKEIILKQILSEDLEKFQEKRQLIMSLDDLGFEVTSNDLKEAKHYDERIKIIEEFLYGMHKTVKSNLHD